MLQNLFYLSSTLATVLFIIISLLWIFDKGKDRFRRYLRRRYNPEPEIEIGILPEQGIKEILFIHTGTITVIQEHFYDIQALYNNDFIQFQFFISPQSTNDNTVIIMIVRIEQTIEISQPETDATE